MNTVRSAAKLAGLTAGLLVSGAAFAQSTWNWGGVPGCDPNTCTVGGVTATVYGFGAETLTSKFILGGVNDVDPSGLGIKSKDASTTPGGISNDENTKSPNHAIDNFKAYQNGSSGNSATGGAAYAEVLAISFTEAVNLTQVSAAWTYTDSDAMVFRWDGSGAGDLANFNPSLLPTAGTSNGWTLVSDGQFATGSQYKNGATVGSLNFNENRYSSYWLVSTALGQSSTNGNNSNDGFKINKFTASLCVHTVNANGECKPPTTGGGNSGGSVPEPGTLALAGAAFLGLMRIRRRQVLSA